jgi:hypothetical protein
MYPSQKFGAMFPKAVVVKAVKREFWSAEFWRFTIHSNEGD